MQETGLAQAALKNTVDNTKTAYINNGTVNIAGDKCWQYRT